MTENRVECECKLMQTFKNFKEQTNYMKMLIKYDLVIENSQF